MYATPAYTASKHAVTALTRTMGVNKHCDRRYSIYVALTPSDPCPTDLDRILTEGQDPGAQQCLALGTVPIKGKNLGFWVPMHFLY